MLVLQCGQVAVVHLILLVVRLDDLANQVNHESFTLSAPIFRLILHSQRIEVECGNFGDDLLSAIGLGLLLMNDEGYQQLLEQLRIEHRDLDDAIEALRSKAMIDQLQIARLKKKKLLLKDRIIRLEDQLIPDIIA